MLLFVLGVVYVINGTDATDQPPQMTAIEEKVAQMPQEARPAMQQMFQILANQVTGEIDPADLRSEYKAVRANKAIVNKTSALDQDVEWTSLGPNNVGGRTRGFLVDQEDDQTLYTGSVSGGIFKSTNGGDDWSVLQNSIDAGCVGITTLAQAENGDIYIGTGSSYESIGGTGPSGYTATGTGVFKTTDGGETFENLVENIEDISNSDWSTVNRIQVYERGDTYVYAATNNGLRLSKDAGNTWEIPKDDSGNTLPTSTAHDVEIDSEGNVYCAINLDFWKSTDGETFFKLNGNGELPTNIQGARKLVAVSQSDPNYIYLASSTGSFTQSLKGIWQSKDGGESFTLLAENSQFLDIATQGAYDFCLDVDPNNPEKIYLGGVRLWTWSISDGWTQVELYFGDPGNPKWIHADKQGLFYHPTNSDILYITCDGGIFKSENATLAYPDFQGLNKNYNTFQCYSIAAGHDGIVMGGAQDNGTQLLTYNYNSFQSALDAYGGDGSFAEISNINPNVMFAATQSSYDQNGAPESGNSVMRSTNGGESFGCALNYVPNDPAHSSAVDGFCLVNGLAFFTHPFLLWEDTRLFYEVSTWEPDEINMVETTIDGETAMVPEFIIDGESFIITPDFEDDLATIQGHNGQNFIVTTDPSKYNQIPEDPYIVDEMYVHYQVSLEPKEEDDGSITYELEDYGFVIAPTDSRFARARLFTGSRSGDLWMTEDALNPSVTPYWSNLTHQEVLGTTNDIDAQGAVTALAASADGNKVVIGTATGRLLMVSNLNRLDGELPIATQINPPTSQHITDIAIDPSNDKRVVFTCGNYGNENYIYETTNIEAASVVFEPIQGNLPQGPIYAIEILQQGNESFAGNVSKGLVVGSRYGIWYSKKSGGTYTWESQAGGLGDVPVFALRQEPMAREASEPSDNWRCQILYAGTHGRGMFRTTTFTDENIDESVYALPDFEIDPNVGVEETSNPLSTLKVYPNPVVDQATIEFNLNQSANVYLNIFDIQGKLVSQKAQGMMQAGKHTFQIEAGELASGNYVISIATDTEKIAQKIIVTR